MNGRSGRRRGYDPWLEKRKNKTFFFFFFVLHGATGDRGGPAVGNSFSKPAVLGNR